MKKKNKKTPSKKAGIKLVKTLNLPFFSLTLTFALVNIAIIIGVLFFQNNLPPEIPLYYGLPRGNNQLATPLEIVVPLIISLLIILVNNAIALITENDFLKKVLVIASYLTTTMAVTTVIKIVFLVGVF